MESLAEPSKDGDGEAVTSEAEPRATVEVKEMSRDEHHLAVLGYRQVFTRTLGLFENWAATFTTMNFVNGMPLLFGFAMYTGGPQAAFANWTMVGGFSFLVSLAMAEIAAAFPTAGGIYYWAYRLGGDKYGALLSWLTAWYNWAGWIAVIPGLAQGNTRFFLSLLIILYPDSEVIRKPWFGWCISTINIILGCIPNCVNHHTLKYMLRCCAYSAILIMSFYWIWFPIAASRRNGFQSSEIFTTFYNGINHATDAKGNTIKQASEYVYPMGNKVSRTKVLSHEVLNLTHLVFFANFYLRHTLILLPNALSSYCWTIGVLFGAWEFYGYDASVHLSEETHQASSVVAKGMWTGTLATWLGSIPTLALVLLCMQNFMGIVNANYANNWAAYLVQLVGPKGAVAILSFTWLDGILSTGVCILAAQRITFAIARDGILPFSKFWSRLTTRHHLPVNACILVAVLSIGINAAVIGSSAAFSALTAAATVGTNLSYLIPVVARHTVGKQAFQPAKWNLGRCSLAVSVLAVGYIVFLFVVLMLPQIYPITALTLNYCPVIISGITIIALGGWLLPFGLGARYWFSGPKRTISMLEVQEARVKEDGET